MSAFFDSDDDSDSQPQQRAAGQSSSSALARRTADSSDDDSYADVFAPPARVHRDEDEFALAAAADSYTAPQRMHVCDECEGSFPQAVFCGECAMTYCLPCDRSFHAHDESLAVHYRQPLHGALPNDIARQVRQMQREEEEEAKEAAERMTAQSRYAAPSTEQQQRPALEGQASGLRRSAAQMAASSVPRSANDLAAAYPSSGGYAQQYGTVSFAQTQLAGTVERKGTRRPSSAAVARTTVLLKSTRPPSATASSSSSLRRSSSSTRVVAAPTRMGVSTVFSTLPGHRAGTGQGRTVLHATSSAMIHEQLPSSKPQAQGEEGAHAHPGSWGHHGPRNQKLVELNDAIMQLKAAQSAMEQKKHRMKTTVLKRQRHLKEIGRIAANLAKQPTVASSAPVSTRVAKVPEVKGELGEKIDVLRTSNEILRLECDQLSQRLAVLRDTSQLKSSRTQDLVALDRERSDLIRQVGVDRAARELDSFKKQQVMADLAFAVEEMKRQLEAKKQQASEQKTNAQAADNATRMMQREYDVVQRNLDDIAARHVQ